MVTESPFIKALTLIVFGGKGTGTQMNGLSPLGFEDFCKIRHPVAGAPAGKYTRWPAIIVHGKSLFGLHHTGKATG